MCSVECGKSQGELGPGHVVKQPIVGSRFEMGLYRIILEVCAGSFQFGAVQKL